MVARFLFREIRVSGNDSPQRHKERIGKMDFPLGLVLNFNVPVMRDGIVRILNELDKNITLNVLRVCGELLLFSFIGI